jgi:hypothetical protein
VINIKTLTRQEYQKSNETPGEVVFYKDEIDICRIISLHLAKNLKESIEVAYKFLSLEPEAEVYKTENNGKILYIIKADY